VKWAILGVLPDRNKNSGQRRILAQPASKMSQIGMGASLNSMAIKKRSAKLGRKGDAVFDVSEQQDVSFTCRRA
jgi:hypothetical protein